jgi:3-deoxy-7-phosphoheptulonate synthase
VTGGTFRVIDEQEQATMMTVIRMEQDSDERARRRVLENLRGQGQFVRRLSPELLAISSDDPAAREAAEAEPAVATVAVVGIDNPFSDRSVQERDTVVDVGDAAIGADDFVVIAGPCSIETADQMLTTARDVRAAGGQILRGGLFKPRTSPYGFQGLGEAGTEFSDHAREVTGLPMVSEIVDVRDLELMSEHVDMLQVGARNMQNFGLLRELGRSELPVLLKRGLSASLDEVLLAAEYVLSGGNSQVVLCERGIRTFERSYRFTLDLTAVPVLKERTHLPVIVDPSHAAGARQYVPSLALASAAVGADGIILETHCDPAVARCDGAQAVPSQELPGLMDRLRLAAAAAGRTMPAPASTVAPLPVPSPRVARVRDFWSSEAVG